MNLLQRKTVVVFCLLGLALTLPAQADRYSVGDPIGFPRIYSPGTRFGNDISAGATITLKCWSTYDYDYDNYTCSTVNDGATITWTAKDAYGNDVGTFLDDEGTTAVWTAPTAEGAVTIYATADDNPDYLADDAAQQHYVEFDIVKRAFVKPDAPGAETGGSWYHAFTDLQDALELAGSGWEIWVAQGTYYPGTSQSDTFSISGAAVYGGFYGNEGSLEEREPSTYVTTLSGDINGGGLDAGNCHQVVSMSGGTLDGFTITMGYNDASGNGGGLGCNGGSPTVNNCTFTSNYGANDGGAVYIGGGSPTFEDCCFDGNSSFDDGGAVECLNASATMTDCEFTGNQTTGSGGMGGAIEQQGGSLTLIDCTISGNTAQRHGGGVRVSGGTFTMTGGEVSGNEALYHDGGGLELQSCTADIDGVTITGNEAMYQPTPPATSPNGDGGGICIEGSQNVTVTNTIIQYNSCYDDGGGVRAKNGGGWSPDAYTIAHCLYNSPNNIEIN